MKCAPTVTEPVPIGKTESEPHPAQSKNVPAAITAKSNAAAADATAVWYHVQPAAETEYDNLT